MGELELAFWMLQELALRKPDFLVEKLLRLSVTKRNWKPKVKFFTNTETYQNRKDSLTLVHAGTRNFADVELLKLTRSKKFTELETYRNRKLFVTCGSLAETSSFLDVELLRLTGTYRN